MGWEDVRAGSCGWRCDTGVGRRLPARACRRPQSYRRSGELARSNLSLTPVQSAQTLRSTDVLRRARPTPLGVRRAVDGVVVVRPYVLTTELMSAGPEVFGSSSGLEADVLEEGGGFREAVADLVREVRVAAERHRSPAFLSPPQRHPQVQPAGVHL